MDFDGKEFLLQAALDQTTSAVVITTPDLDSPGPQILHVNAAFTDITGYAREEVLGLTPRILQGGKTDRTVLDQLKATLREGIAVQQCTWNYRKDGTPYRVEWNITPVRLNGEEVDYFLSVQRDVTEQYRNQKALEGETLRLNALLEAAGDAIITADDQGVIHQFNPAAERMFGYKAESMVGEKLNRLMPEPHATQHDNYIAHYERTGDKHIIGRGLELEVVRSDGSRLPVLVNVTDTGLTEPRLFVGIIHDLTDRKQAEEERLHYQVNFDAATGLPNRRYTEMLLDSAIERGRRNGKEVALAILTLPGINRIAQGFGEQVTSDLLNQAAEGLAETLEALPAFVGTGERGQFLVVIEGLESLGEGLPALVRMCQGELSTGLSEGITGTRFEPKAGAALFPDNGDDASTLLNRAELALSLSLDTQRAAFHMADPKENERLRDQLILEADLNHALEREEFFLLYQPQFDLASGNIVGAEALLRWQHPDRGVISPAEFIPLLEETGLIESVGEWLMRQALSQGMTWSGDEKPLRMAVNLSPRQFKTGRLVQEITNALATTGFPQHRLELEITESLLLENQTDIHDTLDSIQQMGIELALDDFGTGYSALSYLQSFPLHTLKIDRAFVGRIGESKQSEELLRGIVGLGQALNMDVVAEGIETEAHRLFLAGLGCPRGQGFGLARPLSAAAFADLLMADAVPAKPHG